MHVLQTLSEKLTQEYGKGWSAKQLQHCLRTAEVFSENQIVSAVQRQLNWTHIKTLTYIEDSLKREFYIEICIAEQWSTRQLNERINSMLYERTAVSKKPAQTITNDLEKLRTEKQITPELVFRDPYFLDFLGLTDTYSEKDMESAIVAHLERFILELGNDFAFLARQKRITVDNVDYHLDLLFYHRKLQRLVAIDLKLGKFEHSHKSQMELYLRWLAKYEQQAHEQTPIGLILCADKSDELIQLMEVDKQGIHVAAYYTELPPIELLQRKLHEAIEYATSKVYDRE